VCSPIAHAADRRERFARPSVAVAMVKTKAGSRLREMRPPSAGRSRSHFRAQGSRAVGEVALYDSGSRPETALQLPQTKRPSRASLRARLAAARGCPDSRLDRQRSKNCFAKTTPRNFGGSSRVYFYGYIGTGLRLVASPLRRQLDDDGIRGLAHRVGNRRFGPRIRIPNTVLELPRQ